MGIQGLWKVIDSVSSEINIDELAGKVVAIDISCWIHKSHHTGQYRTNQYVTQTTNRNLLYIFKKICHMLSYGMKPIIIFDGNVPFEKSSVIKKRKMRISQYEKKTDDVARKFVAEKILSCNLNDNVEYFEAKDKILRKKLKKESDIFEISSQPEYKIQNVEVFDDVNKKEILNLKNRLKSLNECIIGNERAHECTSSTDYFDYNLFSFHQLMKLKNKTATTNEIQHLEKEIAKIRSEDVILMNEIDSTSSFISTPSFQDENDIFLFVNKMNKEPLRTPSNEIDTIFNGIYSQIDAGSEFLPMQVPCKVKKIKTTNDKAQELLITARDISFSSHSDEEFPDIFTLDSQKARFKILNEINCSQAAVSKIDFTPQSEFISVQNESKEDVKDNSSMKVSDISQDCFQNLKTAISLPTVKEMWTNKEKMTFRQNLLENQYLQNFCRSQNMSRCEMLEITEMLDLLGLPWIFSPSEAEAQCAYMNRIGLCDIVLTEDSDAFIFGAMEVLRTCDGNQKTKKNCKNSNCFGRMYRASDIETKLNLDREMLAVYAMLAGCDYTPGVENIGPTKAMYIIKNFRCQSGWDLLVNFKNALSNPISLPNMDFQLKKKLKNIKLSDDFPSIKVWKLLTEPNVDEKPEPKFIWNTEIFGNNRLKHFCCSKFDWDEKSFDQFIQPLHPQAISLRVSSIRK